MNLSQGVIVNVYQLFTRESPHKATQVTIGAFVISEEANCILLSPPDVAYLFERKTVDGIQRSLHVTVRSR